MFRQKQPRPVSCATLGRLRSGPHTPSPVCRVHRERQRVRPTGGPGLHAPPCGRRERAEGCRCPSIQPSFGQGPAASQGLSSLSQLAHLWLGGKRTSLHPRSVACCTIFMSPSSAVGLLFSLGTCALVGMQLTGRIPHRGPFQPLESARRAHYPPFHQLRPCGQPSALHGVAAVPGARGGHLYGSSLLPCLVARPL